MLVTGEVAAFLSSPDGTAELWADFAAYHHVVVAQLFGAMMDLPPHVPMWTHDFQQELARLGIDLDSLPDHNGELHNALRDAMNLRERWMFIHRGVL